MNQIVRDAFGDVMEVAMAVRVHVQEPVMAVMAVLELVQELVMVAMAA